MADEVYEWIRDVKAVEREFQAAELASRYLLEQIAAGAITLRQDLRPRDFHRMIANLENTYILRLFAEFESSLRIAWKTLYLRNTQPDTIVLIARIGARSEIPNVVIQYAQSVREYRNQIIHTGHNPAQHMRISNARHHLCHYLSRIRTK